MSKTMKWIFVTRIKG